MLIGLFDDESSFKARAAKLKRDNQMTYSSRGNSRSYFKSVDSSGGKSFESIVKIRHQTSANGNKLGDYVTDKEKMKENLVFDSFGNQINQKKFEELIDTWNTLNRKDRKKELEADKERERKDRKKGIKPRQRKYKTRYATHLVFSLREKPNHNTKVILKNALSEVQSKHFSSLGFDSYFTIHQNTKHCHGHLVIHNKNRVTENKIRFSRNADMFAIRKDFADSLTRQGLNYVATMKNVDSLEMKDVPEKKKEKKKDYFTNQLLKTFGDGIRPYLKKMMIESKSKTDSKATRATEALKLLRQYEDPNKHSEIIKAFTKYNEQRLKFKLKKELIEKHTDIDKKEVNSYVDMVFSRQNKILMAANTKDPESIKKYEKVETTIENLSDVDPQKIKDFIEFKKKKEKQALRSKNFKRFGPVGSEYHNYLTTKLDDVRDDSRASSEIKKELEFLEKGKLSGEQITQRLIKEGSKNHREFLSARLSSYMEDISKNSGVSPKEVDIGDLYTVYLIQKANQPKKAFYNFQRSMSHYSNLLKSGDQRKLNQFQFAVRRELSTKPTTFQRK